MMTETNHAFRTFCRIGTLAILVGLLSLTPAKAYPPPAHANNGVFIDKQYVANANYATNITPTLLTKMDAYYATTYFFTNVGKIDAQGKVLNVSSELTQIVPFLNAVKSWENANGKTLKVFAWINGTLYPAAANYYDVANATKRTNLINECKKFVSTTVTGSYIAGANRTFDGVLLDLEPSGMDANRFNNLLALMGGIRSGFDAGGLSAKLTGFAPHKFGQNNQYQWNEVFYYYMGTKVNVLTAMTYNSDQTPGSNYSAWMRTQTTSVLRAVSGKTWNNDANHPAPTNGVKVFMGFPAFPPDSDHDETSENIAFAAPGVESGLADLTAAGDTASKNVFQGAAVFIHTDGTGNDGNASYADDWWWYGRFWLHIW